MNSSNTSISFGLGGRVCIVTGGAQGIGEACARRFAGEGAKTVIADLDDTRGQALASELGALYVRWEIGLLAEMGYGIDLQSCAATGATVDLTHVSPRTGRAVSAGAAAPYADRLLVLPGFLVPGRGATDSVPVDSLQPDSAIRAVQDGLALTGHFLENRLFAQLHAPLPQARARLLEVVRGQAQNQAQK